MSGPIEVGQVWQDVHNGRNVRIAAVEDDEVAYTGGESSILSSYVWYFMRHHRLVTAEGGTCQQGECVP